MKFRIKLVIIFIIALTIQGTAIGAFSHYYATEIAMANSIHNMNGMINLIDSNINSKVQYMSEIIENSAKSQTLKHLIETKDNKSKNLEQSVFVSDFFDNLQKSIGAVNGVMVVSGAQVIYQKDKSGNASITTIPEIERSEIYQKATEYKGSVNFSGLYNSMVNFTTNRSKRKVIISSCAIVEEKSQKILGVLILELDASSFDALLPNEQNSLQSQYTFILDSNNKIIANNSSVNQDWVDIINQKFNSGLYKFQMTSEGKEYYVCGQYNALTGWRTFSVILEDRIFPQSASLRSFIMLFVVMSTLCMSIIIIAISYTMTKPLNRLSEAMKKAQSGDLSVNIENHKQDEIGQIIDSFNYLIRKINSLIREVYEQKIAQKNAEIKAMEAQINPHFLYNTLDSINWMLIEREAYDVSEIIISLGNLMRYSINKNNGISSIEDEKNNVLSYLLIQKNRLENRLDYEFYIPEELYNFVMPKLILQPLVENAILHGIEPKINGGKVTVLMYEKEGFIFIEVNDNGMGMDDCRLRYIKSYLNDDTEEVSNIGIKNVDRRIRLYFGDDFRLNVFSNNGQGTKCMIRIPKKSKGE
ncbi:sensor histidine kinase [Clostridiaceae bacterium UIB06]|uniref:Sensor histidine kinase n=1 Tax=Clostridium thailandense TaxID=2794346 RepID=A0A949TJK1_9CLOT|nr:sensor histidine kinase [Clostridium thailandense]MBV7271712.1 sensor histidine kinase [Clostridium thailandense]MCH5136317.1 sensor histidine kinase [Clostridiaceae bacterium UIB06]